MSYRVFWAPHAEQRLEELLREDAVRAAVVNAARQIDQRLASQPTEFGESRFEEVRIGFEHPLGVQYEVMDDVKTVIVYDLWRIDRRS